MHSKMRVIVDVEQLELWIAKLHGMVRSLEGDSDEVKSARVLLNEMQVVWSGCWVGGHG